MMVSHAVDSPSNSEIIEKSLKPNSSPTHFPSKAIPYMRGGSDLCKGHLVSKETLSRVYIFLLRVTWAIA